MQSPGEPRPRARFLLTLALLWLAGTGLRLTILAVPPVIPLIHDGLKLNATQVGILTGLPSMLFAFAAVPGALLIARLGTRTALVVGLAITALGGALRGAIPDVAWLYAMTVAMGAGVAIMQVTMPPAVRAWFPQRIGFATAVYTNGLLIGEIIPVALTLPLVLPFVGGSWQWGFVFWSVPVAIIAVLVVTLAPATSNGVASATSRRWWPDWNSHLIWRLGIMLGTINAIYFSSNAFLPDYLRSNGQGEWISARALRVECRPSAGFASFAGGRRAAGAQGLALCRLRAALRDGDRRHRIRHRGVDRGGLRRTGLCRRRCAHSHSGAAATVERAGRRAPRHRRYVHHQL